MADPSVIPKSLRVGGRRYPIRRKDDLEGAAGFCYRGDRIEILRGQPRLEEADTVIHEAFHAVLYQQGRPAGGIPEETYVHALATGLVQLIRDNPGFGPWLASPHNDPP